MSEPRIRILVVDDDAVLLATTQALLAAEGYEVQTQSSAFGVSSAILKLHPQVVLLDVNMPGLSGPALAELIRREPWGDGICILFYSSNEDEVLEASVERSGADGYIRKGDRVELRAKVAQAVAGLPSRGAAR